MNIKVNISLTRALIIWLVIFCWTKAIASNRPENITAAESAMLPPYCPYTMGEKGHVQPHISKWRSAIGDGFFNMHHHCWALIDFHRSIRAGLPDTEKKQLLRSALGGFRYVLNKSPEDLVLLPEILTWIVRTEGLLGNFKNAQQAFNQAIQLKRDYWPAYFHFSELQNRRGQRNGALETLKTGLSYSPNAKPLLLLFKELGGRPNQIPLPTATPEGDFQTPPTNE